MPLVYSEDQLVRETQLLLTHIANLNDNAIGQGAGVRALGLDPQNIEGDRRFEQTQHPDDLVDLDRFDVWHQIRAVERYVQQQIPSPGIRSQVFMLRHTVQGVFSTETVAALREEREANPREDIPGRWEDGAGDVEFGHFHLGILQNLVDLASLRLKVDEGEPLLLSEIALLLDIREATVVTNAHRKKFATYEEENRRYSLPEAALPWMIKNGYAPTIVKAMAHANSSGPDSSFAPADEVLFVPAAKDNTLFSPECRINGRYTIGPRKEERRFTDYFAALRELNSMTTPRWRTRRPDGIPGTAWGVRFERVRRADLCRALAQLVDPN